MFYLEKRLNGSVSEEGMNQTSSLSSPPPPQVSSVHVGCRAVCGYLDIPLQCLLEVSDYCWGGFCHLPANILVVIGWGRGMLLASNEYRPGMLLSTLLSLGQHYLFPIRELCGSKCQKCHC